MPYWTNSCCVPSCIGYVGKTLFRFPNPKKKPDLFNLWLKEINNPILLELPANKVYVKYKVCVRHFEKKWTFPFRNDLRPGAVPSIFSSKEDGLELVEPPDLPPLQLKISNIRSLESAEISSCSETRDAENIFECASADNQLPVETVLDVDQTNDSTTKEVYNENLNTSNLLIDEDNRLCASNKGNNIWNNRDKQHLKRKNSNELLVNVVPNKIIRNTDSTIRCNKFVEEKKDLEREFVVKDLKIKLLENEKKVELLQKQIEQITNDEIRKDEEHKMKIMFMNKEELRRRKECDLRNKILEAELKLIEK